MIDKPSECIGCPSYGNGKGFIPPSTHSNDVLRIVGGYPDKDEEYNGEAFSGKPGMLLRQTLLPVAGEDRLGYDLTLRCRGEGDLPKGKNLSESIKHCNQYASSGEFVRLTILVGLLALKTSYPELKPSEWAGHLLPEKD